MPLASWIVTSHYRPELLMATLAHLREAYWPAGWEYEVVVAHFARDEQCSAVAWHAGAVVVPTPEPYPSGKRNAALRECLGELVLVTDDDDFQSHDRPTFAVDAYSRGFQLSGIREFRRLHLATGNVVRWCGRGSGATTRLELPDMPPVMCGTARNYSRRLLEQHSGWNPQLASMEDHELHKRIMKRRGREDPGIIEYDFEDWLADTTIICQHDKNIFERPEVPAGQMSRHGDYMLFGEGHWSSAPGFPTDVATRLIAVGKL